MKILVSACLLGIHCKYSGGSNLTQGLAEALQAAGHSLVPRLPRGVRRAAHAPHPRRAGRGKGSGKGWARCDRRIPERAAAAVRLAQLTGCTAAVLKANSPSCGCGTIYDGTFTGRKIPGSGVAAEALRAAGLAIYNEETYTELL